MKFAALLSLLVLGVACSSSKNNDQPDTTPHNALGTGNRLREVQDPTNAAYAGATGSANVNVTSVVVTAVDNFDETGNGKSRGTIFVQDVDQALPYGGISLYSPTFVPANLRLAPGDVIDMNGDYTQQTTIGTTVNFAPAFLPQMNKPQVTQSYEVKLPAPVVVPLTDLESFDTGRKWLGMLITIQNVTAGALSNSSGRVTAALASVTNAPEMNNELWDLQVWNGSNTTNSFPPNTTFKSVTGICDFFFNFFIAPRSIDDLVQ